MDYDYIIKKIKTFEKFGIKPGLERISKILDYLGNPQDKIKIIHVAGTNGKGSTCNMLSSVLSECGYKTGLYTSPHILDFRERIKICNNMISKNSLIKSAEKVFHAIEKTSTSTDSPTEFEVVTAIAFEYFYTENCDVVILETGLGGLYDATNVIKNPLISVITSISFDHTNILGNSLEQITTQKCGIIKPNTDVVVSPNQKPVVIDTIKKYASNFSCTLTISDINKISDISYNLTNGTSFKFKNHDFQISLLGKHQIDNVCTVLHVVEKLTNFFNIPYDKLYSGLKNTHIPARFEILSHSPLIILDGAHNPSGTSALADNINLYLKDKYIIAIVGMLSDKDFKSSLANVLPLVSETMTVTPPGDRALDSSQLQQYAKIYCKNSSSYDNIELAIKQAISNNHRDKAIVIFGSLYLAGNVKKYFINLN